MVRLFVVLGLVGCGRVGFSPIASLDGSAGADVASHADAEILGPCTKLAISDDFNDGTRAAMWTLVDAGTSTATETGGELAVTLGTSTGLHYAGYDTAATNYDLRDRCIYVSFAKTPTAEAGVEMQFTARTSSGTVGYVFHDGLLDAFSNVTAFNSYASVRYDGALDKVLRVRDDTGTVSWETSADGVTFFVLASAPAPFDLSAVAITLEAGTYSSVTNPGVARYENFDTP